MELANSTPCEGPGLGLEGGLVGYQFRRWLNNWLPLLVVVGVLWGAYNLYNGGYRHSPLKSITRWSRSVPVLGGLLKSSSYRPRYVHGRKHSKNKHYAHKRKHSKKRHGRHGRRR